MRNIFVFIAVGFFMLCTLGVVAAQTAPTPMPAPSMSPAPASSPNASGANALPFPGAQASTSPSPTPSPRVGTISVKVDAHTTFISSGTRGAGTQPLEGPGFAAGSPLSPLTPYDTLTSAPYVPGNAGEAAIYFTPTYIGKSFDLSLALGAGYVRGSVTNAAYWGESLYPSLNPHLGSQTLPYAIAFPTRAGSDDGTGFAAGLIGATFATRDKNMLVRAGRLDLTQTDSFVFTAPAISSVSPTIGMITAESLGDGTPSADWWQTSSPTLPLHGVDAVVRRGIATLELTDAALPSLPGVGQRLLMGSLVFDHGEGTRFSAQVARINTGGAIVGTTVLYGANARLITTPQGQLPISEIGGQRQTIFGLRGAFHAIKQFDAVLEYGHSTYDADHVALPGTGKPGNYYHAGISRTFGRVTASVDAYRNEPYYAQVLLPYGAPENVWSVAWSWPGQWLKSNYQAINDFPVNIDRQGYRLKYVLAGSPLQVRAIYANFGQIDPITLTNARQTGFIDGFFLPQLDSSATLGRQNQYGLYVAWDAPFGRLAFDYAEDTMRRRAVPSHPEDLVAYDSPEAVLTYSRAFGPKILGSLGVARYAMRGSFGQGITNVDYAQRFGILGVQVRQSPTLATLASLRFGGLNGMPTALNAPPPDFRHTLFVIEQRFRL